MIYVISDSLSGEHSFWPRIGQYLEYIGKDYILTDDYKCLYKVQKHDKAIIYRYGSNWPPLDEQIKKVRNDGAVVITDIDDYLWFDGETRGWTRERLKNYHRLISECSIITCSTKALEMQLQANYHGKKIIEIRNSISTHIAKYTKRKKSNKIRVGWTGAPWTRPHDLLEIKELCKWMESRKDIQIVHIGNIQGMPSFANSVGIKEINVEKINYTSYKEFICNLDLDIGLAPLSNGCFNSFKSAIKIIEYSSLGIPWIASNIYDYKHIASQWGLENNRLCETNREWITNVEELLDKKRRVYEGNMLKEISRKEQCYSKTIEYWRDILK